MTKKHVLLACVLAGLGLGVAAQDTQRGRRLFADTAGATGKPVASCVSCHASTDALRGMIENAGGQPAQPRSVRGVLQKAIDGAVPGARNAKAQYRGALTARDLEDLSAYIATARAS